MTRCAVPFPVEESASSFRVAKGGALSGRRIQRAQPLGKGVELVGRQIERRHAATGRSPADEGTQLLRGTAADVTIACKAWAAVRAVRVTSLAAGALLRIRSFTFVPLRILARQKRETQAKGCDDDSVSHACFAPI